MEERGSILVWPLIDNVEAYTIIDIANQGPQDVNLECHFHGYEGPTKPDSLTKLAFTIALQARQVFFWETYASIVFANLENKKGLMFCIAVDDDRTEKDWDFLKGDAVLWTEDGKSFQYNAIPHQAIAINESTIDNPDDPRVLRLDGHEYTMATSQIMFEGFAAEGFGNLNGTLVIGSLDVDLIASIQPEFNINFTCYNQEGDQGSLHVDFKHFEQYPLHDSGGAVDLELHRNQVFTDKFQCSAIASDSTSSEVPMWAIFLQISLSGPWAFGGNVWQEPSRGAPATVVLPPIPN
jgi:hypothetical protein